MIRKAEEKDAADIRRILHQVHDVHAKERPDLFIPGGLKYDLKEIGELIRDEGRVLFVHEEDGEIDGYIMCISEVTEGDICRRPRRVLYVDDLCVDEKVRRKGIGSALYHHVRSYAKKERYDSITLNVWECNPVARRFYERLGLAPMKTTMEDIL